jgi:hypothetical protein
MIPWQISQPPAWKIGNSPRNSTVGCHKKLRSTLTLAGGTFLMLNAEEAWALFEKLSASERECEEHGLKENSHTVKIYPLTRKFQGMPLTQPTASETHQAKQEILAHPSNRKKMPMSRISSDAISTSFGIG